MAGLDGLFCGTELRPKEGLRMLSIEKERDLVGEERTEAETASSSVGVGGGEKRRLVGEAAGEAWQTGNDELSARIMLNW